MVRRGIFRESRDDPRNSPTDAVAPYHEPHSHGLVGWVATEADVGMLVISHIVPVEMTANDDPLLLEVLERHYDGPIMIGRDLMWL